MGSEHLSADNLPVVGNKRYVVTARNKVSPSVYEIRLEPTGPREHLRFRPGQYVFVELGSGDETRTAAFSLCLPPNDSGEIAICTRATTEASDINTLLATGGEDRFGVRGPLGDVHLPKSHPPLLMIAAGTGIAPFRAMYDALSKWSQPVTLLYGARHLEDLLYHKDWQRLAEHPSFTYVPSLTAPAGDWAGQRGRVTTHLDQTPADSSYHALLCGHPDMVRELREALIKRGIPDDQIHSDC